MTMTDVVKTLIGPIRPVGCSQEDAQRYANLIKMITLLDDLIEEVYRVSEAANSQEFSTKKVGQLAQGFIKSLKE